MLYGALGTVVRVGANVLLLPLVLQKLTPSELALWWVFIALGALANLADFGFGQALSRVYSYLWAGAEDFSTEGLGTQPLNRQPNLPRLRVLNATVGYLYFRVALIASALLAIGGTFFIMKHAQMAPNPMTVWWCWGLYLISVSYGLIATRWVIACQGVNRVREVQASNLWSGLGYMIVASLLLIAGGGLYAMVAATMLRGWIMNQICRRAYHQAVPPAIGDRTLPEVTMLRKLWPNAWKFGVLSIGVYLTYPAQVLLCNHLLDEYTASYGLTQQVGMFLMSFSGLWLSVKWPEITILRTQGRLEEMAVLFARRLALVMATFLFVALLLVLLGNWLLELKGTRTQLLPNSYLIVYLLYLGQQLFYAQFGSLVFTENVVPFFQLSLLTGLTVVVLSAIMTWQIELWGLILGPLIAALAVCTWYVPWRAFRGQPLNLRQFVRAAALGHV